MSTLNSLSCDSAEMNALTPTQEESLLQGLTSTVSCQRFTDNVAVVAGMAGGVVGQLV